MHVKKFLFPIFLFLILVFEPIGRQADLFAQHDVAGGKKKRTEEIRLLIIGNSFSQNASRYLPDLAIESGTELIIGRAELGGCSLQRHWKIVEAHEANRDDPKGRQYKGKSLRMLLAEEEWDFVTIQQNSMNSTDISTYRPYAENLFNYIKKLEPDAEVLIHQTWAYRTDSKNFGRLNATQHARDAREMYERSRSAYHSVAAALGVRVIPVGDAFWLVSTHPDFAYKTDGLYNFQKPQYPDLPDQTYSLHRGYYWKDSEKLAFDSHHANEAGEFLGSLVWYGILFNQSPKKVEFTPDGIPADFAKELKSAAKKAVN